MGELAEVTLQLPALPQALVIAQAALRTEAGQRGVWRVRNGALEFVALQLGRADLDGYVQVRSGLAAGDELVLYSEKPLTTRSRIKVVAQLSGSAS